jgi:hypothetical protein
MSMLFKVTAQGDTIYVRTQGDGRDVPAVMAKHFGAIPAGIYNAKAIEESELPAGEEVLE